MSSRESFDDETVCSEGVSKPRSCRDKRDGKSGSASVFCYDDDDDNAKRRQRMSGDNRSNANLSLVFLPVHSFVSSPAFVVVEQQQQQRSPTD